MTLRGPHQIHRRRASPWPAGATLLAAVAVVLPLVDGPAQGAAQDAGTAGPVADAQIEIRKGERLLIVYSGTTEVRRFPIGLGPWPVGPKRREGDGATPEGTYRVCVKNPQSRYFLSLGLDYPNLEDADHALDSGLIDGATHRRIAEALGRGRCPPWNTGLGGEIYIHGRGSGADWTLGCVALDDPAMEWLYTAVGLGAGVTIRP